MDRDTGWFARLSWFAAGVLWAASSLPGNAQIAPTPSEVEAYRGLHAAAAKGDVTDIQKLASAGAKLEDRDSRNRTPLHVAAFFGRSDAMATLIRLGADPNALETQRYDIVTIAAVNNDVPALKVALAGGGNPRAVTSPYDGTALIAAAHLGHVEVVRTLIAAGAPLDHVNNLGWTALIEAIVLGDGGANHTAIVEALVQAGCDVNIADRQQRTPLALAGARGYANIAGILRAAGAR